jgi:sulfoxide reductase heme-binding subunit YedZ
MTRTRIVILVVAALVIEAIAVRLGFIADPIPKLASAAAWTTSRAAGVTAFAALTLDVMFGLFVSTGLLDRWVPRGTSVDVHKWLSGVSLALVGVHATALFADSWVRFDALDALVPGVSSYRPGAVAIGVLAMWGAALVHASFGWRKRIGVRAWRAIHFTAFAVFMASVAHGITAGSDTNRLRMVYVIAGVVVTALVVTRIALSVAKRAKIARDRSGNLPGHPDFTIAK